MKVRICFVCLGNICRSPTAEAVMRDIVDKAQLGAAVDIDSAGTGAWHAGEPPDRRSAGAAERRGLQLGGRARQVTSSDFTEFDYLVAMDRKNAADLKALAPDQDSRAKVHLLRDFEPDARNAPKDRDVPDPYYGGDRGFENVLDICQAGCAGLLEHLQEAHDLGPTA